MTTFELFFDLVDVLVVTQVSALLAHSEAPESFLDAVVVLALLWWTWCSYAWPANGARADVGVVRLALVVVLGSAALSGAPAAPSDPAPGVEGGLPAT